jgi:uncharacterized protein YegP (UPF0339 family)
MNLHSNPLEIVRLPTAANDRPAAELKSVEARRGAGGHSRFDIYRSDTVSLTSTLFGGGDWHWRLADASGVILADCGGYRNQAECFAAVDVLRAEAGSATVSNHV